MKPGVAALFACGIVIAGCGGGSGGTGGEHRATAGTKAGASAPPVTLRLRGASKQRATTCGTSHRTAAYPANAMIRFAGVVAAIPTGRYKVRVKVKVCRGGAFVPVTEVKADLLKKEGTFSGILPALPAGSYFARASVVAPTQQLDRSEKRHFTIG